jgi:hypothetical protein
LALALQLLAVLAIAALLGRAVLTWHWHTSVAIFAATVGLFLFAGEAWNQSRALLSERSVTRKLPPEAVSGAGGGIFGAREDFLAWVDGRLPRRARVFLACRDPGCAGALPDWITFRLQPRRFVDRLQQADYVLIYNATARDAGLRPRDAKRAVTFAPRFQLAPVPR